MFAERRQKPVDVWDHTNAMGCGIACALVTPFAIVVSLIIAWIIDAFCGACAWIMLPVTILAVPALWVWIFIRSSTWTREEAQERGRESEWDASRDQQTEMERNVTTRPGTRRYICGEMIEPGEEFITLESRLMFLDMCESEEDWQAHLDELFYFIEPARDYLEQLSNFKLEDQERADEVQSEIADGTRYITEAEWIMANQEEALAQWRGSQGVIAGDKFCQ